MLPAETRTRLAWILVDVAPMLERFILSDGFHSARAPACGNRGARSVEWHREANIGEAVDQCSEQGAARTHVSAVSTYMLSPAIGASRLVSALALNSAVISTVAG